jgi:hypothetical protein
MLGKLISLLLHAKSGAISGVFLLGATGALVSVSASNGVTTITITEASPSPSASVSPSPSASASASPTASPSASPSPSASSSASPKPSSSSSPCSDEAKALAFQVQRVDKAFSGFHTDLMKLRGQRSVVDVEKADVMLKVIRQAAVKAIHATATQCKKQSDDEDESDETEAHDAAPATTLTLVGDKKKHEDEDNDGDHAKTKPAPMTFTGDAKSIADQAVAAMQVAFDTAKNAPASTPKPSHKPEPAKGPKNDSKDKKGEHGD